MKDEHFIPTALFSICALIVGFIGGLAVEHSCDKKHAAAIVNADSVATPAWSRWCDPRITSDMWDGTTLWQTRTNLSTGECEIKSQTVSTKGGYYKQHE